MLRPAEFQIITQHLASCLLASFLCSAPVFAPPGVILLTEYKFRCPRDARLRSNVFAAFLAPQCAALRCPWMGPFLCPWCVSLLVPVVRLVFLFTAHVQQNCTTVQYCRYIKNDDHEPRTTKFHLIYVGSPSRKPAFLETNCFRDNRLLVYTVRTGYGPTTIRCRRTIDLSVSVVALLSEQRR
jgi:hypothetical protein